MLSERDRTNLINNIVGHLSRVTQPGVQERMLNIFNKVDPEYGRRVAEGLLKAKKAAL